MYKTAKLNAQFFLSSSKTHFFLEFVFGMSLSIMAVSRTYESKM